MQEEIRQKTAFALLRENNADCRKQRGSSQNNQRVGRKKYWMINCMLNIYSLYNFVILTWV